MKIDVDSDQDMYKLRDEIISRRENEVYIYLLFKVKHL